MSRIKDTAALADHRTTLKFLEDLCLAKVKGNWTNDEIAAKLAEALLEVAATEDIVLQIATPSLASIRAHRALRLLKCIEQVQSTFTETFERTLNGFSKTKRVLWRAAFIGILRSDKQKQRLFLIRQFLDTVAGSDSEQKALKETLSQVLGQFQLGLDSKLSSEILSQASQGSNLIIVRAIAHSFASYASPLELRRAAQAV